MEHKVNLKRATQPLGVAAVLLWSVWFSGARSIRNWLPSPGLDPAINWRPVALFGAGLVLFYGLASVIVGTRRCWGVRSDGMLPVGAFFKLALGVGGLVLLRRPEFFAPPDDLRWLALNAAAVWCAAVGGGRFILLTVGGNNALGRVNQHIQQTRVVMRPARCRPWWKFW